MATTAGMDVSQYQGEINWELVAAAGYHFAFIRATVGSDVADSRFGVNWQSARDAGLFVSAYHAIQPDQPAGSQMDHFFGRLGDRQPDLPLGLDVERSGDLGPAEITACLQDCIQRVEQRYGRKPILYTARWFWNPHIVSLPSWSEYDLWVASYTAEPLLPAGWDRWTFWQYSETGQIPGVGSRYTDLDWFAGTEAELLSYARRDSPPPGSLGLWARVTAPVNIRSGPGIDYDDIGDLDRGARVRVLALAGQDAWIMFEPGKWALFTTQDKRYLIPQPQPYPTPGLRARVTAPVNIRSGPGTDYDDIGDLNPGDTVDIVALGGQDIWIEFDLGRWAVFATGGKQYMALE